MAYPNHIVPPLPEKHSLFEQIDRYDRDFITSRMQLLHRFLNRVADHPVLSCDKKYQAFLTVPPMVVSIAAYFVDMLSNLFYCFAHRSFPRTRNHSQILDFSGK